MNVCKDYQSIWFLLCRILLFCLLLLEVRSSPCFWEVLLLVLKIFKHHQRVLQSWVSGILLNAEVCLFHHLLFPLRCLWLFQVVVQDRTILYYDLLVEFSILLSSLSQYDFQARWLIFKVLFLTHFSQFICFNPIIISFPILPFLIYCILWLFFRVAVLIALFRSDA